jgi:hypothetical protein
MINKHYYRIENRFSISENGCWEWNGTITKKGYGYIKVRSDFKTTLSKLRVHRISYEYHFGDIGDKLVCHSCDNRRCFNPAHLFLGTYKDNYDDCKRKGRRPERERMPITDKSGNIYYGYRDCAEKTGLTIRQVEHRLTGRTKENGLGLKKI